MNLKHFPYFFRKNYPQMADVSDEHIAEIGIEFKSYLQELFKDKMDKLDDIWNIDPMHMFKNLMNRPHFTVNGFHPALFVHFDNFVQEQIKNFKEEQND